MSKSENPSSAEGVIKYALDFLPGAPPEWTLLEALDGWRRVLFRLGLIGRDPHRYGGLAYGNVSRRLADGSFLVSGTQTGGLERFTARQYCRVTAWDGAANRLWAEGALPPSSEALTHAAAYAAQATIQCVLHVHSPELWQAAPRLGIAVTDPAIPYGTPAMAAAVQSLLGKPDTDLIAMGGHEDGLLAVGETAEAAALALIRRLSAAFRLP